MRHCGRVPRDGPHCTLANFLEAALLHERGVRHRHEIEREAVEHGVDASAPQLSKSTCTEGRRIARAAPDAHACGVQLAVLLRTPSAAERQAADPVRILDRLEPYATRGRLHKQAPTTPQPSALEGSVRRAPRHGQRRRLLIRYDRGLGREQPQVRTRYRSERRMAEPKDGSLHHSPATPSIARNGTTDITTRGAGITWILAKHIQYVSEIEAHGPHAKHHLAVTQQRQLVHWLEIKVAKCASRVHL